MSKLKEAEARSNEVLSTGSTSLESGAVTRSKHPRLLGIAADAVLMLHVLVAVYIVAGAFLAVVDPIYALVHIPLVLWVALVNLARWTCPLTPLEQRLRTLAGQKSFEISWTRQYCEPIIRPMGLPRRLELVAGVSVLVWNAVIYAWIFSRITG